MSGDDEKRRKEAADRPASEQGAAGSFTVGDWQVRPLLATLTRTGRSCRLERKPMQVLSCLALAAPHPVTREELRSAVWPGVYSSDQALTRCIVAVRRALDDRASDPRYLETIPKVGYRIIAPVCVDDRRSAWEAAFPERGVEEASRGLARQLGGFLAGCRDHVYLYTPDCRFAAANAAGAEALGVPPGRLVGKHWRELDLPEEAMLRVERLVRQCAQENTSEVGRIGQVSIFGEQAFEYVVTPLAPGQDGEAAVLVVVRAVSRRQTKRA